MTLWDLYEKSQVFAGEEKRMPLVERNMESASMFVMGVILREVLGGEKVPELKTSHYSFEQIWYSICLYHNAGYEKKSWRSAICRKMEAHVKGKQHEIHNLGTMQEWNPLSVSFAPIFSEEEEEQIRDYFYYKTVCRKDEVLDHGVVGGLLLYDSLVRSDMGKGEQKTERGWDIYGAAAKALMLHEMIREMGKGKIKDNPFLELLLMAEAAEPLHMFRNYAGGYRKLLGSIGAEIRRGQLSILLDADKKVYNHYGEEMVLTAEKLGIYVNVKLQGSQRCITLERKSPVIDEIFI